MNAMIAFDAHRICCGSYRAHQERVALLYDVVISVIAASLALRTLRHGGSSFLPFPSVAERSVKNIPRVLHQHVSANRIVHGLASALLHSDGARNVLNSDDDASEYPCHIIDNRCIVAHDPSF
jgi:hypothetical protein